MSVTSDRYSCRSMLPILTNLTTLQLKPAAHSVTSSVWGPSLQEPRNCTTLRSRHDSSIATCKAPNRPQSMHRTALGAARELHAARAH